MKKTKIILQCLLIIIIPILTVRGEQLYKSFHSNQYFIKDLEGGRQIINMSDFGRLTQKGYPALPSKTFFIQLPRGARVKHIDITPGSSHIIPGHYNLKSADILFPLDSNEKQISEIIQDHLNKKKAIYSKNQFYPESIAEILNPDLTDDNVFIRIRYTPIQYNPVEKSLKIVDKINVRVDYSSQSSLIKSSVTNKYDNNITTTTSLLIISSETVKHIVEPYMVWKKCLGIKTEYISIEWIEKNEPGKNQAEKIREFLKKKHSSEGFENVLLIGDQETCPIQYLYPNPDDHSYSGCIASDFYFTNLSSDWDIDNDKHLGEFEQDKVDWLPELNIGRIPWSDSITVQNVLNRIIAYEKNHGSWKNNALLLGSITNFKNEDNQGYPLRTDGAYLMEELKNDIFNNSLSTTMYEQEGIEPSQFDSDLPLNSQNIITNWSSAEYGCITWWSHGNTESAERKWWLADDGDNIPESGEVRQKAFLHIYNIPDQLNNHPVIFANACHIGAFSPTGLGRKLIQQASTGIVAASGTAWCTMGWNDINAGGSSTLSYYFWEECIKNEKSLGEALKSAKIRYLQNYNDSWYHLNNIYTFNLFGDPTLKISNSEPLYGSVSGKVLWNTDTSSISGIDVTIPELNRTSLTDPEGNFTFDYLPEGEYHITASSPTYEMDQTIVVKKGEMITTELHPIPNTESLTVRDSTCNVILQEGENKIADLILINNGNNTITYNLAYERENNPWLTVASYSSPGIIESHSTDTLLFQVFTDTLDRGEYNTSIDIYRDTCSTPCITIPINLTVIDTIPPAPIDDLIFTQISTGDSVKLTWTAPGDNGPSGTAEQYDIILSKNPFQNSNSQDIKYLNHTLIPQVGNSAEHYIIPGNDFRNYPYIAIRTWDEAGLYSLSNEIVISTTALDLNNNWDSIPQNFVLQNYPNPFNLETTIEFGLSKSSKVDIMIFNDRGQIIEHLINHKFMDPGKYAITWNGSNSNNTVLPSGLYLYKISIDEHVFVKKMTLVK